MRVTLLGTGSADGWPNPFCDCASCTSERAAGRSRQPSSALVDGTVLVDCGPTAAHAASAAGTSLRTVEHVLVTHGHPDHLDPAFLLARDWVASPHVLHVWAPPGAIDLCRDWIGPSAQAELHPIVPGERLELDSVRGRYVVDVLAAQHSSGNGDRLAAEAVLFVITSPMGDRLLYATDTADLPADTVTAIGGPLDVALVDETFGDTRDHGTGHLDLDTLPRLMAALRRSAAITDRTVVVATHLSHHNPPTPELQQRLAPLGVRVLNDRDVIDTSRPGRPTTHLVLGGARSGKSLYAEGLVADAPQVTYVATGGGREDDSEWTARVQAHRDRRPNSWTTVETIDVAGSIEAAQEGTTVLVDCLALWLTGHLDAVAAWTRLDAGDRNQVVAEALALADAVVDALLSTQASVVLVSNEVGMGVVPPTASGRLFQDLLGGVNARVSAACDRTTLIVAGQPIAMRERRREGT